MSYFVCDEQKLRRYGYNTQINLYSATDAHANSSVAKNARCYYKCFLNTYFHNFKVVRLKNEIA